MQTKTLSVIACLMWCSCAAQEVAVEPTQDSLSTEEAGSVDAEEQAPSVEQPEDIHVDAAPDLASWRHHAKTVSVAEMGLSRRTVDSDRMIGTATTEIQHVTTWHSAPVNRLLSEASIIRADGQIEDPERIIDLTVLVLGRIGVSESGWDGEGDLRAIYQVLRTTRRGNETLIASMRRNSRVVSELWRPVNRRERWLVGLSLDETMPIEFPEEQDGWDRTYKAKWHTVLTRARALVEGRDRVVQCPVHVIAWGGRCDVATGACDDQIARRRGLVPVESCGNTQNRFWARSRSFDDVAVATEMRWRERTGTSIEDEISRRASASL